MALSQIKCPNCQTNIEIDQELQKQMERTIKDEFDQKYLQEKTKLDQERKAMAEYKANEKEILEKELGKRIATEKTLLEKSLKNKLQEENQEQFAVMQKELTEKSEKLKELNKSKAEISKLQREKEELRDIIKLESERELNEQIKIEREKIQQTEKGRYELKQKELEKQLEDQKKLTEEMQRKQEQGSVQLQGEVQELAIEEWLRSEYPLDTIEEIKKGARGADSIQIINTRTTQNCGRIYYESKRTENFQDSWIEKFKDDMREKSIDVGVLVTKNMPKDMERMGMIDGVWVCSYEEFKGLSRVLRESIIKIHNVASSQVNKGEKMQLLYDYLSSPTFKMQLEAIVNGFTKMKADLDKEKRSLHKIWKEREKQIEKVTINTIEMYASVRGIAGSQVLTINSLELDEGHSSDEDS